jgi:ribosome-associated protein
MATDVRVSRTLVIPSSELRFRFAKSGGPGGQNVNKRETQVELLYDVAGSPSLGPRQRERIMRKLATRIDAGGVLHLVASEQRTQGRNREIALERLRTLLRNALKADPPKRKPTRPSKTAVERRIRSKRLRGERKRARAWREED